MKETPELRFEEFEGKWRTTSLGNVSEKPKYGLGLAATDFDGMHKYLRITDIDENSRNFQPNPLVSPDGEFDDGYKLKTNDIVFARTGASVGKTYIYQPKDGDIYFAGFLILFRIIEANPRFIFYLTLRGHYRSWVLKMSMRSGQPGINAQEYSSLPLSVPELSEQQKIASSLSAVDEKISKLQHKLELLQTYKCGVMQKLFSQELRFTKEDGSSFPDWEEKRLGDIINIKYGKDHKSLSNGKIPVYGTGGIMRHVDTALYKEPSVLIGRKGTINKPFFLTEPFWTVDTLFYSEIQPEVVPFFAYLVVLQINWLKYNEATGVPSLNTTSINRVKISIPPDKSEQQKIATFLSALDNKIEAVNKQISLTEHFKKGLLQQMFI